MNDNEIVVNSLRYRGYVYDWETGLYYCNSRYYDPETGRFINADSQLNTSSGVLGYNIYAYCENNPVNKLDYNGNKPGDLFDTIDDAAMDAALYMGPTSFENGYEYGASIYKKTVTVVSTKIVTKKFLFFNIKAKVKTKTKIVKYTYTKIRTSKSDCYVNLKASKKYVATVHTHVPGNYFGDEYPSPDDIYSADRYNQICFVYGSFGKMSKYYPNTDSETALVLFDMPVNPATVRR